MPPEERHDRFVELKAAAEACARVRFRVKPDYRTAEAGAYIMLAVVVLAGILLMNITQKRAGTIVAVVIISAAVAAAIAVAVVYKLKSSKVYYCYCIRDENGVFCMSVVENRAVVFAGGTAYRINGDEFYMLDADGFRDWLDGECCGIYSVLSCTEPDVELVDDAGGGYCYVRNRVGGGHRVFIENGEIVAIASEQPYYTDETDARTGERKIKTRVYEKIDPTDEFEFAIPDFVEKAFAANGVSFPTPSSSPSYN